MPLDTSIPLQAKFTPINYEAPQPLNTLMSAMKLKQLSQQSDEYERARTEEADLRNYLATKPDLANPEARTNLLGYGKTGATYAKALSEQDTAELTRKKTQFEVQDARRKFVAQAQRDTSQNPSDANITAYKEDLLANPLFSDAEKAQMAAGADRILSMPVDQRRAFMSSQGASASELKPTLTSQNLGGLTRVISTPAFGGTSTVVPGSAASMSLSPEGRATDARERERIANAENPNAVAKQVVGEDGTVTNFNKFGQVVSTVKGAGKQSATYAKTEAQKKTLDADRKLVLSELAEAVKEGGLIDQSTGSGAGRLIDVGAGFFGKATEGDIAIGRLQPIADIVLKTVPRFEGPQSDKDTASYKEAAGNLANANLPRAKRKAAANEIIRLMKARQGQFITSDMASGNTATPTGVAPPEGFVPDQR
jgi:hypothetical protein